MSAYQQLMFRTFEHYRYGWARWYMNDGTLVNSDGTLTTAGSEIADYLSNR